MAVNNSWSQNRSMNDWMRDIEKRLMHEERRPSVQPAENLVGPGIGTYTRRVDDWNSPGPNVNGFFYSYGDQIVNSPDDTLDWVGLVLADPDGHGFQQVWNYVEGVTPDDEITGSPVTGAASYTRSFITNDDGSREYSNWTAGSGGGGGIAGIIIEEEGIVVNGAALGLNFVGAGVTASGAGNESTIEVTGIPPANSVGADQIIDGSVTTTEIANSTILVEDLNTSTIDALMVDVAEDGATVVTNANRINFIGTNVLAEADGLGGANVTISGDSGGSTPGVGTPVGTVSLWTGTTAPQGWLLCQGGTFPGSTYPELRDLLGDKFGVHSGDNYFLPDYRDRYPLGASTAHPLNTASTYSTPGASNGPLMTAAQVGQHSHGITQGGETTFLKYYGPGAAGNNINVSFDTQANSEVHGAGHELSINNSATPTQPYFPPYLAQNFIIKAAPGGGTEGTNMLVIADEGATVASAVTKLNFVGNGVVATAGAAGEATVTVAIPTQADLDARYVNVTGDAMTGDLTAPGIGGTGGGDLNLTSSIAANNHTIYGVAAPVNSDHVATKAYVDATATAARPEAQEEGATVVTNATAFNFVGTGVTVTENPAGIARVEVTGGGGSADPTMLIPQQTVFTASGVWTKPANCVYVVAEVQAGGGAGGGVGATNPSVGSGGGGGGYAKVIKFASDLAANETVTVGAGGVGVAGTGGTGGTSSFGTWAAATGGGGGPVGSGANSSFIAGAGGLGTAGDLQVRGQTGENGYTLTSPVIHPGQGGDSFWGHGAPASHDVNAGATLSGGVAGQGYGGGGAGAMNSTGAGSATGGDGAPGLVIVTAYVLATADAAVVPQIQAGTIPASAASGVNAYTGSVNFPAPFPSPPIVVVSGNVNSGINWQTTSVTATGFTWRSYWTDGLNHPNSGTAHYIATLPT